MRSYEVKQCFENCRVPPFFPLNFRVHHVFPWAMLFALVAVQPCLKASVHFLELLLQGPYFGEGNWKPFCRTYPFRALLQSPWFQICKPFCKAFFQSSDALGSPSSCPCAFSCVQCATQHHLHQSWWLLPNFWEAVPWTLPSGSCPPQHCHPWSFFWDFLLTGRANAKVTADQVPRNVWFGKNEVAPHQGPYNSLFLFLKHSPS